MFELQKIEKIEIKYQPRNKCLILYFLLPFKLIFKNKRYNDDINKQTKA